MINALADGYTPSADGLSHKVTLRAGLTFHDGSLLDAGVQRVVLGSGEVRHLAIRGEVKWVVRDGQPIPPEAGSEHELGMGIRFLYESEEERRAVESVVERLMIDSLGQLIYSKLMSADRGRG